MRKMVTIRQISDIRPIEGADAIECLQIDGWTVVSRKGIHKVNDFVYFFEVDSLLPDTEIFRDAAGRDGLKKSMLPDLSIVEGYRIKSIKLRGQLSQGMVMPLSVFGLTQHEARQAFEAQTDFAESLGVTVYEKPVDATLYGKVAGSFPSFVPKTDVVRVQNQLKRLWEAYENNERFEISYKLDGSSCTVFRKDGEIGVASRNMKLRISEDNKTNAFVVAANKVHNKQKVSEIFGDYVFQGELLAPKIQGNFEGVKDVCYYIFAVYDVSNQCYLSPTYASEFVDSLGLDYVPVANPCTSLRERFGECEDVKDLCGKIIEDCEGGSGLNGKYREGFVYKSLTTPFTFKAISPQYLLKN